MRPQGLHPQACAKIRPSEPEVGIPHLGIDAGAPLTLSKQYARSGAQLILLIPEVRQGERGLATSMSPRATAECRETLREPEG